MPRHRPTPEQRQNVIALSGLGATPALIAGMLGVSTKTVESVYAKELATGPDQVKLEAMKELFRAAKGNGAGKVSAATRLLELLTDDEAEAGGAVRPNGKVRILYHDGDNYGATGIRDHDGVTVPLFDTDGCQVIVCHPQDALL
jgi:hypothetical protein